MREPLRRPRAMRVHNREALDLTGVVTRHRKALWTHQVPECAVPKLAPPPV